jgi:Ser/Thr protein kinase RdoA (MazF antagonist)
MSFLRAYHSVTPLTKDELLFLKEAYRFFILNYVLRVGEHFFQPDICSRLQHEAIEEYLPHLELVDFEPLLEVL